MNKLVLGIIFVLLLTATACTKDPTRQDKNGVMIIYSHAGDFYEPTPAEQCNQTIQQLEEYNMHTGCELISGEKVEMSKCQRNPVLGTCYKCTIKCDLPS